jgi:hypothetical protein
MTIREDLVADDRGERVTSASTCQRHGTATQLACATCQAPICPRCVVRTEVGLKCSTCTGAGRRARSRSGLRAVLAVLLVVGVLAIPTLVQTLSEREERRPPASITADPAAAAVGEEVSDGSLDFTVRSFTCEPVVAGPTTRRCLVVVGATNQGSAPEGLFGGLQFLVDAAGRRHGPEEDFPAPFLEVLNPGESGELTLAFDVPVGIPVEEAELHGRPASLGARVRLEPTAP